MSYIPVAGADLGGGCRGCARGGGGGGGGGAGVGHAPPPPPPPWDDLRVSNTTGILQNRVQTKTFLELILPKFKWSAN